MISNLHILPSAYTPEVHFKTAGSLSLSGKSYPENTFEFYKPVLQWVQDYFAGEPAVKTVVTIELIYFNSSSSKLFFDFFDLLDENKDRHQIEINWLYDVENESAKEAGEDFVEDFEYLNIQLITK
ncbi:MAG: DUF1987 domain-containing protein [Mariprofundaceae bacterium]|nr:DUF1987 domain-containing protein [Mariprofundaceae bacterium]